ncbi:MAG: 2-succinyl-5-enolpyruvyl-6-hydroxy-3-cyclohexene-1-carboxylic-acid synthase [Acidimicrobiales bacterium]
MTGPDVQAAFALALVDEWARAGVTDAVVSPGSRSTPLLVALGDEARIRLHVVLDERSAGFVALGLGLATGRPALVVTTSGTAAVELHPAVVEAHHSCVPLVAVTADRPPELHHVGAPQTVEQEGLFGQAPRFSAAPGVADMAGAGAWRALASRAWAAAAGAGGPPGPVHLNLAFREPLLAGDPARAATLVPAGRPGGGPWHSVAVAKAPPPPDDVVADLSAMGEPGLVVAGAGSGDPAAVEALGAATGWAVLADPASGCRVPGAVGAADALLRVPEVAGWRPEVVVRLGRPWASRVLGDWLGGLGPEVEQVLVDPYGQWADPARRVDRVVVADPSALCRAVSAARRARGQAGGGWAARWRRAEDVAQRAIDDALAGLGPRLTEPGIARSVVGAMPAGGTLTVSSSMPVRDVEWFSTARRGLRVLANRGANGIDGVVSTTLGVALAASGGPVVGLVGDLAFLYDAGALFNAAERPAGCTLVVVDNDGGGIFSFLPQAGAVAPAVFERLWATPHGLDLAAVAEAYGVPATVVTTEAELAAEVYAGAGSGGRGRGLRVVVARTDRAANVEVHRHLDDEVRRAVQAARL